MRGRQRDISRILVHFRPTDFDYEGMECLGQIVAQFDRDFVMRTPIKLEDNSCLFLRVNSRALPGGPCKEIQAFGRVVSERLADGKLGYLIHIL
jgi:hypothetical protein